MKYSEFYERVCNQLKSSYGWRGPVMYLATHLELLDVIHDQYTISYLEDSVDWSAVVASTALKVDLEDRVVTA